MTPSLMCAFTPRISCNFPTIVGFARRRLSRRASHAASRIVWYLVPSLLLVRLSRFNLAPSADRSVRNLCVDPMGSACAFIVGSCTLFSRVHRCGVTKPFLALRLRVFPATRYACKTEPLLRISEAFSDANSLLQSR